MQIDLLIYLMEETHIYENLNYNMSENIFFIEYLFI